MWWLKGAFMMLFHPLEMVTLVKRKRKEIPILAIITPFLICARNSSPFLFLTFSFLPLFLFEHVILTLYPTFLIIIIEK